MLDLQIARRAVDAQFSDCTFWHFLALLEEISDNRTPV
jgi:hypothetical protein